MYLKSFTKILIINFIYLSVVSPSSLARLKIENSDSNFESSTENQQIENNNEYKSEDDYYYNNEEYAEIKNIKNDEENKFWSDKNIDIAEHPTKVVEEFDINNSDEIKTTTENIKAFDENEISLSECEQELQTRLREMYGQMTNKKPPADFIVPQYMSHLYQMATEAEKGENVDMHKILHGSSNVWGLMEETPSRSGVFKFELPNLADHQEIIEAELHLYRIGHESEIHMSHVPYIFLQLYQLLPSNNNENGLNPDMHQLLSVRHIPASSVGWQVFKIKRTVELWRNGTNPNLGLLLTAKTFLSEPIEIRFARKGIHSNEYQPILVLYTAENHLAQNTDSEVKLPNARPHSVHKRSSVVFKDDQNTIIKTNSTNNTRSCILEPFYVNFTEIGFFDFIVAPPGYETYQCVGKCSFPIANIDNPSSYAVIQSILKNVGLSSVEPSCVPIKGKSVTILRLDGLKKVVMSKINNLIPTECGCR